MFLLPCPSCQKPAEIAPTQAGDTLSCPACGARIQIPKLGELRQLPQSEEFDSKSDAVIEDYRVGRRIGFVVLSLISVAALFIAGFCGLQWYSVDAPLTTETYMEEVNRLYTDLEPAKLIREYEDMEKYGLAIAAPYRYKVQENEKRAWGRKALIGATAFALCGLSALLLMTTGRQTNRSSGADT